ncbi:UDP-3-O-(3-hydroxymyristoyl)glucosamine N-acyltransferase [Pseudaestuariivita atlantica]|uniref:UDP-3-O-acylglucosamine N-acyltransferase n=1 Tax=Pseudaestuariivita atlantica TaxID=1317121 RepID=A0A0L1JUV2_9RHOB|nr:UDP-3-O-(3-hydroxymyristoyl)glucosamine N-acyltransferase [Pseudaestuariivita atlantica]KNG95535.1 UDP-3-O-(3-hydroxymyristoyl) glucosamine N-acyltransferase [Pseudaestuariivita atlantica]
MRTTLADIAAALRVDPLGDADLVITGITEPADAGPEDLALAMQPAYIDDLAKGGAVAALLPAGTDWQALGLKGAICPDRPRYALAGASAMMDAGEGYPAGLHPTAFIDPSAQLGDGVSVGPLAVIGAGAQIGANSVIGPQVHVGAQAQLGQRALLREGVRIGARVVIGDNFIAQPGAVVGGDGFSFVTPEKSTAEDVRETLGDTVTAEGQAWARIHSLGGVLVGDDVEIGANSCIDRGTVRPTRVGDGCKIDNLVQIGHNVVLGRNCLVCAGAGIAGSSRLGDNVVVAGMAGVADNISVGDNVVIAAASAVLSNVPAGRAVMGYPAVKMETNVAAYKASRRLPRLLADVASLKKAVFKDGGTD